MRSLCLILGLILLAPTAHAVDFGPTITREAGKCAKAWQRGEADAIVSYLPPRVIQRRGGRAAVLREIKDQFAEARSLGAQELEAIVGRPPAPKQFGSWLAAVIPLTAVLHGPHVDLTQRTQVLALSADRGRHWYFVLLYQVSQAELNAWFPEFGGKIVLPADPAPQIEIVH